MWLHTDCPRANSCRSFADSTQGGIRNRHNACCENIVLSWSPLVYDHVDVFRKGPSSHGRNFHEFESAYRRLKMRRMLSRGNISTQTNTLLTFVGPSYVKATGQTYRSMSSARTSGKGTMEKNGSQGMVKRSPVRSSSSFTPNDLHGTNSSTPDYGG